RRIREEIEDYRRKAERERRRRQSENATRPRQEEARAAAQAELRTLTKAQLIAAFGNTDAGGRVLGRGLRICPGVPWGVGLDPSITRSAGDRRRPAARGPRSGRAPDVTDDTSRLSGRCGQ